MPLSSDDHKFITMLDEIRKSSHDPDRQVGVLIADSSGKIISTGVNEPPAHFKYDLTGSHRKISDDPQWKYFMLEHAERNAIFQALKEGLPLQGSTMYGTLFPCADCARAIVAADINRIVVPEAGANQARDMKWQDHYRYARDIFELSGVQIEYYSPR